jgi:hypothetical protein
MERVPTSLHLRIATAKKLTTESTEATEEYHRGFPRLGKLELAKLSLWVCSVISVASVVKLFRGATRFRRTEKEETRIKLPM